MSTTVSRAGGIAIPAVAAAALYSRPADKAKSDWPTWKSPRPADSATAGPGGLAEPNSPASAKRAANRG